MNSGLPRRSLALALLLSAAVHALLAFGIIRLHPKLPLIIQDRAMPYAVDFIELPPVPLAIGGSPASASLATPPPAPAIPGPSVSPFEEPSGAGRGQSDANELDPGPGVGAVGTTPSPARTGFGAAYIDPRLYVDAASLRARLSNPLSPGLEESAREGLRAVPDSMAAQAERESRMGFGRRNGQITRGDGRLIMPTDGRIWETAQRIQYDEIFVRDSIQGERARVMRERADAARMAGPNSAP